MVQFAIFYFVCSIFVVNVFCQSNNPIWYSYQFGSGGANREELHVESVTSDPTFHFGKNVSSWKSITTGRKICAVGVMETGVTILNIGLTLDREKFSTVGEITELNVTIADMELFNHWNQESKQTEIILVTASESELRWYKIMDTKLKLFWTWSVNRKVIELQHFKLLNQQNLLIISKSENSRNVDIYKINLETSQYNLGLIQSFPFGDFGVASAINHFGSSTFLSLAQQHSSHILVYKYTGCEFVSYQNISSENVNHLSSFKIGFKSFLTVGGQNAGIYQFTKKGIVKEEVRFALQNIYTWFPISTQTYRDDVILFFQREVEHSSHTSYFLEAVIYTENRFVIHDEVHCELHGETEYGISCIIDVEVRSGLMGSAVVSLGKVLGLIVPGKEQSVLFLFKTRMKELKGLIDVQVKNLQEFKEMAEAKISMQDTLKHLYNDYFREHPLKNESELYNQASDAEDLQGPLTVKFVDEDKLQKISSDSLLLEELPDDQILEKPWKFYEETKISLDKQELQKLKREVMKIKIDIEYAKKKLSNAVQLNNSRTILQKLTVNGNVRVGGKVSFENVFCETINDKEVDEIFNDIVRSNNLSLIQSNKTFLNLKVQSLSFEDLQDSRGSSQNGSLIRLNKNIEFFHPVTIKNNVMVTSGKVNNHHFPNDVVIMGKSYEEPFKFEDINVKEALEAKVINDVEMVSLENERGDSRNDMKDGGLETLTVFGNITVKRVNDEDFESFLHSLCLTNIQTNIPGETTIDGELNIDDNLKTLFLNELLFPDDYATTEMEYAVISGHKTFNGVVTTTEALVDQTINGINFDNMIGFHFDQTVPNLIFQNLEVHNLDLRGRLDHPMIKNFEPSPTLEESNVINVAAHFRNLDVTGNVVLSGNYNGHNFENKLNDVVYKDEENATIDSIKALNLGLNVINEIQVESKKINDILLDSFVTTTTDQDLIMETLTGSVYFENLHLEGLFGDVNITELDQNTIKLEEDQIVPSTLIFQNNNEDLDLTTTDFEIVGTLNNLTAANYFFTTENTRTFPADINFDIVKADTLSVDGNITASLDNFSLEDFEKNRLSLGGNQSVIAKYKVLNLTCTSLDAPSLNDSSLKNYMDFQAYIDVISTNLSEGKLKIENLFVNGSIHTNLVNNENITQFQINHWKNKNNYFNTAIFKGDVHLKAIDVQNLNGFNVAEVSKNLIFKNESDVTLDGSKVFENGFQVLKMLNSEHISGVHVDHVFRKTGHQVLMGPLAIEGNVLITSDFDVLGNLNGVPMQYLLETYSFADNATTCIVKGDIFMEQLQNINHLEVQENVNNQDIAKILENLVYKDANRIINGTTTFANKVHVKQNLNVEGTINDVDFSEFVDDMVLITEDAEIESELVFTEPVLVKDDVRVFTNLETPRLCEIDLQNWIDNAVYVNKGKIPGKITFDSVTIHTDVNLNFINGLDLQSLIPLKTKQYINESLSFTEITPFHNISVKHSVNNLNLSSEMENSLLTTSDYQEVISNVVFEGNVFVRDNLTIWKINNNFINQIVTTNSDQNLTGQYVFEQDVTFRSNLLVDGLVNGINITEWDTKSAKTVSKHAQIMTANWFSDGNITFMENVQTGGLIGEIDIKKLENEVTNRSSEISLMNSRAMDDYVNVCKDIKETAEKLEHQIYLFKHFDVFPNSVMDFDFNIKNVLYFEENNGKYLIIFREDCQSNLYRWNNRQFRLVGVLTLGSVENIIPVYDDDSLYFITKSDKLNLNCFPKGTNVWKFEKNQFKFIQKLEDSQVLQDSLIPGMFYTLNHGMVTRYSISPTNEISTKANRKWKLKGSNYVSEIIEFVPKGLGTGPALSNGPSLFKLIQDNTKVNEAYAYNVDAFTWGKVIEEQNPFIFKPAENNMVVLNVGKGRNRKSLAAITYEEDTAVRGKFYFIKIYEDISKADLFQVIPTYKPSSLLSLEFGNNGETLFLFLENNEFLQVYEYKGLAGFRPRTRISTKAKKLVRMSLPCDEINESKIIGLIGEKKIKLLKAVMTGNQFNIGQNLCAIQHDSPSPV